MKQFRRLSWAKVRNAITRRNKLNRQRRSELKFESLEPRLALSHSPTDHIHARLSIVIDGQPVAIPANVGVGIDGHTGAANPHTHDTSGLLHVGEGAPAGLGTEIRFATLDDFFDIWRTDGRGAGNNPDANFDSTHILNKTADATHQLRMFVNGVQNTQFEQYIPEDGDEIVIRYDVIAAAGTPSFAGLSNVVLAGGSPLYIPVDGADPDTQALTYTVTSSNPGLVQASVSTGNPSLKISVQNFGDMIFQMFQDKAPRPTNRVIQLANQGFYNNLIFHRVIDGFVIQGGDPNGTGTGGSTLGNFDDQFNVDLQHNRRGILSFAKSSDDTNNSQFFITETPTQHLDFNHSIFGILVQGENVRDAISNVPVDGNSKPITPVRMTSVTAGNDLENGLVFLKAAEGASGEADVTVTTTDSTGKSFSQTFHVFVTPDNVNGGPFLNDVAAVRTQTNVAANFQLTSQDVEGDAVQYGASTTSTHATVSVNATTGAVTVTPEQNFVGTVPVTVSVQAATGVTNDTADKSDIQLVNITIAPNAPGVPDLSSSADTGASTVDNLTSLKLGLQFVVPGVTSGATVELKEGTTVLGTGIAGATGSVAITTNVSLSDGMHMISAVQTVSGASSNASSELHVTVDSTAPSFTTTAPTEATAGHALTYDANVSETSTFALVNQPAGVNIDTATGVVTWTPTNSQVGPQTFGIQATDTAGNLKTQTVNVNVADGLPIRFRLAITDVNGNPISGTLHVGDTFEVRMFAQDRRDATPEDQRGVFSAYMDVTYDGTRVLRTTDAINYSSTYPLERSPVPEGQTAGLVDELGATASSITPLGDDEFLIANVRFRATGSGTLTFEGNPADDHQRHAVLVYGVNGEFPTDQVSYGTTTVIVESSIGANPDVISVDEDTASNTLDVLANDKAGSGGTLVITNVSTPTQGGVVSISGDSKTLIYTPAPNFSGTDKFSYTVSEGSDTTTASVDVQVFNINDPPTAKDDTFTIDEDSGENILDVIQNDTDLDPSDKLHVTTFTSPSKGGTITLGNNGLSLKYQPAANFNGTDTFTYTVADGAGATSTANVTVKVTEHNDAPNVLPDTATVDEDSSGSVIQVLTNDTDVENDPFSITSADKPAHGTASVSADKKSVSYTPDADFAGNDTFTYTIADATGNSETTVAVTVKNINDPPNAVADQFTSHKNSAAQTLNVLGNDNTAPDTLETLTIQTTTQGSNGGKVTVATDSLSLSYTPATDFVGKDTFSYTISDGHGGTDTATVDVEVVNFIPSTFSGNVFIDANNDGIRQSTELPIAGVAVKLSGTETISNEAVDLQTTTAADGSYSFTSLAPGNYKVAETQPIFLNDGSDRAGSGGGTISANDEITIQLAENTAAKDYSFAERGRSARFLTLADFTARRRPEVALAAVNGSTTLWSAPATRSDGVQVTGIHLVDSNTVQLTGLRTENSTTTNVVATLSANSGFDSTADSSSQSQFLKIYQPTNGLDFVPASSGSGEGESVDQAIASFATPTFVTTTQDSSASSRSTVSAPDESPIIVQPVFGLTLAPPPEDTASIDEPLTPVKQSSGSTQIDPEAVDMLMSTVVRADSTDDSLDSLASDGHDHHHEEELVDALMAQL